MKDIYLSLPSGGGKITDIESIGDGFIRFKNGYQICWGLEISSNMDHISTCGGSGGGDGDLDSGIMGGGGSKGDTNSASFGDNSNTTYGGTKAITFQAPFTILPYIVISPASGNSYQTSNDGAMNPPAAWYHNESTTGFTAELSTTAVKLTWIAIGKWK